MLTCEVKEEVVEGGGDARGHLPYEPGRRHGLRAAAHDAEVAPCQRQVAPQLVPCTAQPLQAELQTIALKLELWLDCQRDIVRASLRFTGSTGATFPCQGMHIARASPDME